MEQPAECHAARRAFIRSGITHGGQSRIFARPFYQCAHAPRAVDGGITAFHYLHIVPAEIPLVTLLEYPGQGEALLEYPHLFHSLLDKQAHRQSIHIVLKKQYNCPGKTVDEYFFFVLRQF